MNNIDNARKAMVGLGRIIDEFPSKEGEVGLFVNWFYAALNSCHLDEFVEMVFTSDEIIMTATLMKVFLQDEEENPYSLKDFYHILVNNYPERLFKNPELYFTINNISLLDCRNTDRIIKFRIHEKDFPAKIPEDIGHKPLEVVNEAGETVALFYDTSFLSLKTSDPFEYIKEYDNIFVGAASIYSNLEYPEDKRNWCRQHPAFDSANWSGIDSARKARVILSRLAYPYTLSDPDEVYRKIFNYRYGSRQFIQSFRNCINDHDLTILEQVIRNLDRMDENTLGILSEELWDQASGKLKDLINKVIQNINIPVVQRKRLENLILPGRMYYRGDYKDTIRYTLKALHKKRIPEKDFPANIPEDIGKCPLEIINEAGETIALFYDISFFGGKFQDPLEYIKQHDQIFKYWGILEVYKERDRYSAGNLDMSLPR